jgi:hypothetical protein
MIVGSDVDINADGQSGARGTGGVCGRMVVKRDRGTFVWNKVELGGFIEEETSSASIPY